MLAGLRCSDRLCRVEFICRADVNDVDLRVLQEVVQFVISLWNRVLCGVTLRAFRAAAEHACDCGVRPRSNSRDHPSLCYIAGADQAPVDGCLCARHWEGR